MPITFTGSSYSQDFNTLASSGTNPTWANDLTLDGWYLFRQPVPAPVAITDYLVNNGGGNAGSFYSYGSSGSSDRALGGLGSGGAYFGSPATGNIAGWIAFAAANNTGSSLSSFTLSFDGEQWRNGGNTTAQTMVLEYGFGSSFSTVTNWITPGSNFNWTSPVATATAAAVDGNTAGLVSGRGGTISGVSWGVGETLWIRWVERNDTGNDHGLAIDNFTLTVTPPTPAAGITIVESSGNTTVNEEGETTDTYTIALNSTPTSPVAIAIAADAETQISQDGVNFFSSLNVVLNNTNPQTITVRAVNDTDMETSPHTGVITHTVTSSDTNYNGLSVPNINANVIDNDVTLSITKIHQIQGTGTSFNPSFGGLRTIEGVVVGSFLGSNGLTGFYVQEEDTDQDTNLDTSEGIFVFDPTGLFSGGVGSKVQVTGLVAEFTSSAQGITGTTINSSLTQLSLANTVMGRSVVNLGTSTLPSVTSVTLPVTDASDLERYEGMLVTVSGGTNAPLTVTNNFTLGRFGQVGLSAGDRLFQYTQVNAPSVSGFQDFQNNLLDNYIILDDGSSTQNPATVIHARNGQPLSATNTLRGGDTVDSITGILDQRFEGYRVQTSTPVNFTAANPRENAAPAVGGTLKLASFNLLNFFNGNGTGGGFPTSRGADTLNEYNRQLPKTVAAILGLNADVIGYNEMENDGFGSNSAVQALVNALNAVAGAGTYAFITPPVSALINGEFGGDEITVGFLYKTSAVRVAPGTSVAALTTGAFAQDNANRVQRPALAVTFERLENGIPTDETFTTVINHFKSKGSSTGLSDDGDAGDGQGLSNATRTRASQQLADWLETNPTGTTDPDYLIMGDLNAYRREDPIRVLEQEGYTSLFDTDSYSFQFRGQWGSLDHALANGALLPQVTGAEKWHINADEPGVLDYNTEFKSVAQQSSFYNADPFASSDHDPLVVGLNPTRTFNVIAGTSGRDTLTGTERSDRITGGLGGDTITTGGGRDQVIYTNIRDAGDTITDFTVSLDKLDLSQLFTGRNLSFASAVSGGFLNFVTSGSNTLIRVDIDGSASTAGRPVTLATVQNVSVSALNNAVNFIV